MKNKNYLSDLEDLLEMDPACKYGCSSVAEHLCPKCLKDLTKAIIKLNKDGTRKS